LEEGVTGEELDRLLWNWLIELLGSRDVNMDSHTKRSTMMAFVRAVHAMIR
jgi:hypothetical protein